MSKDRRPAAVPLAEPYLPSAPAIAAARGGDGDAQWLMVDRMMPAICGVVVNVLAVEGLDPDDELAAELVVDAAAAVKHRFVDFEDLPQFFRPWVETVAWRRSVRSVRAVLEGLGFPDDDRSEHDFDEGENDNREASDDRGATHDGDGDGAEGRAERDDGAITSRDDVLDLTALSPLGELDPLSSAVLRREFAAMAASLADLSEQHPVSVELLRLELTGLSAAQMAGERRYRYRPSEIEKRLRRARHWLRRDLGRRLAGTAASQ